MDEARAWQAREGMRKVHQDPNQTNGRSRRLKNPYRIDKDFLFVLYKGPTFVSYLVNLKVERIWFTLCVMSGLTAGRKSDIR